MIEALFAAQEYDEPESVYRYPVKLRDIRFHESKETSTNTY